MIHVDIEFRASVVSMCDLYTVDGQAILILDNSKNENEHDYNNDNGCYDKVDLGLRLMASGTAWYSPYGGAHGFRVIEKVLSERF